VPVLRMTVTLEVDGIPIPGYPLQRRLTLTEGIGLDYQKPADGNSTTFTALPETQLPVVQALLLKTDSLINLRFNGQTTGLVPLNAGGFLAIFDANLNAGALTNVTVNNPAAAGAASATIKGYAAGS